MFRTHAEASEREERDRPSVRSVARGAEASVEMELRRPLRLDGLGLVGLGRARRQRGEEDNEESTRRGTKSHGRAYSRARTTRNSTPNARSTRRSLCSALHSCAASGALVFRVPAAKVLC